MEASGGEWAIGINNYDSSAPTLVRVEIWARNGTDGNAGMVMNDQAAPCSAKVDMSIIERPAASSTSDTVGTRSMRPDSTGPSQGSEKMKRPVVPQGTQMETAEGQSQIIGPKFGMIRQPPDPLLKNRMRAIGSHLKKEVKVFSANDYGYVNVLEIIRGCSIWVHHTLDNWLVIDLLISPTARRRYKEKCSSAVDRFKGFFEGEPIIEDQWAPNDRPEEWHDRYAIDIKAKTDQQIVAYLDKIRSNI